MLRVGFDYEMGGDGKELKLIPFVIVFCLNTFVITGIEQILARITFYIWS